ncbi:MAG: PEP-CTERM sorting domain-containing protein [Sphingomonas sp.]|nr:PEP-CTERM sorting domain-containing protein [Sphingomonas sp.]
MGRSWLLRTLSAAACLAIYPAEPATAGRTVVDGGSIMTLSGYCSPETATNTACSPYNLPTAITIGGTTYNQFYVNSNGSVSFASIESFLAPYNVEIPPPPNGTLSQYGSIPVFSPNFVDGAGYFDFTTQNYDGNFIADTTLTASGFSVNWYTCGSPLFCGTRTVDLISGATFSQTDFDNFTGLSFALAQQSQLPAGTGTDLENFLSGQQFLIALGNNAPVFNMTLTALANGFQVDYNYNPAADALFGFYGYNLPTGTSETFFELNDRTYVFTSTNGVPEPSTWMSMLLGVGVAGFALRRKRQQLALA